MNRKSETEKLLEAALKKHRLDADTHELLMRLGQKAFQDKENFEEDWKRISEDMKRGARLTKHRISL